MSSTILPRLRDGSIRVAHISDLHFGSKEQSSCWTVLKKFLREDIPGLELVFVTGDIVHTPWRKSYETAKRELQEVHENLLVCPGNHDRHFFGNKVARILEPILNVTMAGKFDQEFGQSVVGTQSPTKIEIERNGRKWRIVVVGVDSSSRSDFFARGYVGNEDLDRLGRLTVDNDADLVVMLVHHHLGPIPQLEEKKKGKVSELANVLGMVNSGRLLEVLGASPIDLVLHGHQHARHVARFGGEDPGNEVCIVGAGSGTGNNSATGCKLEDSQFNVLTLNTDYSIDLHQMHYVAGKNWIPVKNTQLFSAASMRRARYLRNPSVRNGPARRRRLSASISPWGSIDVTSAYHHWMVRKGRWGIPITCASGEISEPELEFVGGEKPNPRECRFELVRDNTWQLLCCWDDDEAKQFKMIRASYTVGGGAVLTKEELDRFCRTSRAPGTMRLRGYEDVGVVVVDDIERLDVMVSLPRFLEPLEGPCVFVENQKSGDCEVDVPELNRFLDIVGPGRYQLSIPYPWIDHVYGIAWKPRPTPERSESPRRFEEAARSAGDRLLVDVMSRVNWENAEVAAKLFIPNFDGTHTEIAKLMADSDFEPILGPTGIKSGDFSASEHDFRRIEFVLPVCSPRRDINELPWAILQIAGKGPLEEHSRLLDDPVFQQHVIDKVIHGVLSESGALT